MNRQSVKLDSKSMENDDTDSDDMDPNDRFDYLMQNVDQNQSRYIKNQTFESKYNSSQLK